MKKVILGKDIDVSDTFALMDAEMEAIELKEYALDTIETYENEEIAQMVREGVFTLEEVEAGLRRRMA